MSFFNVVQDVQPCATFSNYSIQAVPPAQFISGLFISTASAVRCKGNATSWRLCYYASTTDVNGSMTDFGVYRAKNNSTYTLVPGSQFTAPSITRSNRTFNCSIFALPKSNQYIVQPGDIVAACVREGRPSSNGKSRLGIAANVSGVSVMHSEICTSLNNSYNLTTGLVLRTNISLHVSLGKRTGAVLQRF